MNCPICSCTPESTEPPLACETDHWIVKLAPNQCLLGRCVVCSRRHVGSLEALSHAEMDDFHELIRRLEPALVQSFDAAVFNWSCFMNQSYGEVPPDPHVHWWVVRTYDHAVQFNGITFHDPHFGSPYDHDRCKWFPVR